MTNELVEGLARAYHPGKRVADVGGVDAAFPEPLLFKGKETEEFVDQAANQFDSSLPPGPNLRRNQIIDRDIHALQVTCKAQVEIRAVGQEGGIRTVRSGIAQEPPIFSVDARQVADDFSETDNGQTSGIDDGIYTGTLQFWSRASVIGSVGLDFREGGYNS